MVSRIVGCTCSVLAAYSLVWGQIELSLAPKKEENKITKANKKMGYDQKELLLI